MSKILYVGQITPKEKITNCTAYSAVGDNLQKKIIFGLNQYEDIHVDAVSCYSNASWPAGKKYISGARDSFENGMEAVNVSYINIPLIKQLSQKRQLIRSGLRIAKRKEFDFIMVYNMYPQFGGAALKLAKRLKKPLVAILADFPNDGHKFMGGADGFLRKLMNAMTWRNVKKVKYAIVLNPNAQKYMAKDGSVVVVPGGVDVAEKLQYNEVTNRNLVYAGALTKYSGVLNLIEAVKNLRTNETTEVCLKIYGNGPLRDTITKIGEESGGKIKYEGSLPIDDMRKVLRESWVLVNPRSTEDFVSTVTFPSKIFEYVMCGRPVISTEFDGMTEKIKKVVCSCGKGTPSEIRACIEKLYAMSEEETKEIAVNAYETLVAQFSWEVNARKIKAFLEGKENEKAN